MRCWEYTQSSGRKSAKKSTRRLSEEFGASKDTIHRQIKTLRKSYRSCRSVPYELSPQQAQRRVDTCSQLIGNPLDYRFIRRFVTCNDKLVYYRNPDPSKQWLGHLNLAKLSLKIISSPQSNVCLLEFWRYDSLGVCSR